MAKNKLLITAGVIIVIGAGATGALYVYWDKAVPIAGLAINYVQHLSAPPGTTITEIADASAGGAPITISATARVSRRGDAITDDWPSYNKTPTSERYSSLHQINTTYVSQLKVLCTHDTHQYTSFETGPIVVNGALIATTEHDIFSLNPVNCQEN